MRSLVRIPTLCAIEFLFFRVRTSTYQFPTPYRPGTSSYILRQVLESQYKKPCTWLAECCTSTYLVRTYLNTVLHCIAIFWYLLPCTTVHDPGEIGFSIWYSVRMPLHLVQRIQIVTYQVRAGTALCQPSTRLFVLGFQNLSKYVRGRTWSVRCRE